jgi:hypothetical protein
VDTDACAVLILVSAVTGAIPPSPGSPAAGRESWSAGVVLAGLAATAPPERT